MIGNQGYLAIKRQVTPLTAVLPDVFVPLYEESIMTNLNLDEDNAVFGTTFARLQTLPGQRSHGGDMTVMAEPDSSQLFFNMVLPLGTVSGTNPYTWPFGHFNADAGSHTLDISNGLYVSRFVGAQAGSISPNYDTNKMRWQLSTVAALKAFHGCEIAGIVTTTVTLKTDYDRIPTICLLPGDLVRMWRPDDTFTDFTIVSKTNTTVTLSTAPTGHATGDMLELRPATVSLSFKRPYLWSDTQYCFGSTAAAALSATHTPVEKDTSWTVSNSFQEDMGEMRSGSLDPAALHRTNPDAEITIKKFFDSPKEVNTYNGLKKTALVIRCYSEGALEFRLTLNNLRLRTGGDKPGVSSGSVQYKELAYTPTYDQTDGQAFDAKVINARAAV